MAYKKSGKQITAAKAAANPWAKPTPKSGFGKQNLVAKKKKPQTKVGLPPEGLNE